MVTSQASAKPVVAVGVSGGIAVYKALDLVRALQREGLDPRVIMTRAAEHFVAPLSFAALTGHKVITSLWAPTEDESGGLDAAIEHIDVAQTIDALVVAPATAHTLAKLAHGLADDFLTTLYLATKAPIVLAPAMNVNMWDHPATQANLAALAARGHRIVQPGSGYLACGMTGSGRLADTPEIVAAVLEALSQASSKPKPASSGSTHDLLGETILITAGGTREPIDPVRFIGNRSSGKMGYALAQNALARGAKVILVSAPTALSPPPGCEFVAVTTSAEMAAAVLECLPNATVVIGAAAVSDFRPATVATGKLHRSEALTLTLEPTADILAEVSKAISVADTIYRTQSSATAETPNSAGIQTPAPPTSSEALSEALCKHRPKTLLIAFAAETDSATALDRGSAKLLKKGADAIVINDVSAPGTGFDADSNAATLLTASTQLDLPLMPKSAMAARILDQIPVLRLNA